MDPDRPVPPAPAPDTSPGRLVAELVEALDAIFGRTASRLEGLTQAEFEWGPPGTTWALRPGADGVVRADWADPDPVPAPLTTIGWRVWHIAVDCLDSYSVRLFGATGSGLEGTTFVADVDEALDLARRSFATFRAGVVDLGEDGLWEDLGPAWGRWATSTRLALVLHAIDEIAHHGGELGLLRDLYARQVG